MAKSIYLTDELYSAIVYYAEKCGFTVKRGRGSQLSAFVFYACATARPNNSVEPNADHAPETDTTRKPSTRKAGASRKTRVGSR